MFCLIKEKNCDLYQFIIGTFLFTIAASLFVFMRIWYRGSLRYAFLIWNIFLAWVPFYLSLILTQSNLRSRALKIITAFLWIIFYPNDPYIITDFIHLSAYNFYKSGAYAFNANFNIWYDFFLISIFVVNGLILSYASLNLIYNYVKKHIGRVRGWICVGAVSALSGYAIYLGRFIMVNSWEVVSGPRHLLGVLVGNLEVSRIRFTGLFGGMVFMLYVGFYLVGRR